MRPFVIFDRDGTLIVEKNYLADPDGVELLPDAAAAIETCAAAGLGVIVVSNQSGVGRGYFGMDAVERVNARMIELLGAAGRRVERIYICPHAPEQNCECRKPKPGLVLQAAQELGLDPRRSFVVGDKLSDVELARNAGARAVLVSTGYGGAAEVGLLPPDSIAAGAGEAAAWIARQIASPPGS